MRCWLALLAAWALSPAAVGVCAQELRLAAIDHSPWDALLKQYVNEQNLVDYQRLSAESLPQLDAYLAEIARPGIGALNPNASKALLINAYNALTVRWVLRYYPLPSIWSTPDPFRKVRHTVGGKPFSLDEIESLLRQTGDARIHAALVCAARSCPPLRREAYAAAQIDEQLDDNTRRWLADKELNRFDTAAAQAQVSSIFKWYPDDFKKYPGSLEGFLRHYAPGDLAAALGNRKLQLEFLDYDWGLNDQAGLGENYSSFRIGLDWLRNLFRY
jgi:hypothetical protein